MSGKITRQELDNSVNTELDKIVKQINPINFSATNQNQGTQISITWTNPNSVNLLARELYVSTTDITNANRDYCNTNTTLLDDTIGTGSNSNDSYVYSSNVGTTYYFKIFAIYEISGDIKYSDGVSNLITATDTTPPSDVTNLVVTEGNAQVDLTWTDPTDSDWAGTKIIRKTGSYPVDENDGVAVVNSTVKNQYSSTPFTDTGLTNNTTYYYQAFPYDVSGNYNTNTTNRVTATPVPYYEYGIEWDKTADTVTRLGDASSLV